MKKSVFIIAMLAACSFIACQKEQEQKLTPVDEPEKEVVLTTISASAGEVETKTSVDGLQVKWSKNDVIAVADEDDNIVEFELQGEGGTASGSFDGDLGGKALGTYAVYPSTTNSTIVSNSALVDYIDTWSYGKSEVPMYGINDGTGAYTFSNIGGAILISYSNVPATANKFRITETNTGAAAKFITGTVEISDLDSTPSFDFAALDGQTVTITGVEPDGEGNASFVIPVPAGEGYIFRFELLTSADAVIPGTQKIASNQTITANKIKRFPTIAVPGTLPNVRTLVFDFTSEVEGWAHKKADAESGDFVYTINAVDYSFSLTKVGDGIYQTTPSGGTTYLMMNKNNALGLPVITGYRLSKITIHNSTGCSTSAQVGVVSNTTTKPYVDDARAVQTLSTTNTDYIFDITASYKDKRYYLFMVDKNTQMYTLTLTYEESSRVFTPTPLTMSTITCTSNTSSELTFGWTAVANAAGYQISTDGGENYGAVQPGITYTWGTLNPLTEKTIYVKAVGDGDDYQTSAAGTCVAKTKLAVPTGLSWTEGTMTLAWTNTNTAAGTYSTAYKYVYTTDNGVHTTDASSATTAVLDIAATTSVKVKAVCIADNDYDSDWTSGFTCTIGGGSGGGDPVYSKVTSISSGSKYILVQKYGDDYYVIDFSSISSNTFTAVDASTLISNGQIASNSTTDNYAVTITKSNSVYSLVNKDDKYVVVGSNASLSATSSTLYAHEGSSGNAGKFRFTNNSTNGSGRGLLYRNGYQFKSYAMSNAGNTGYADGYFELYEYTE